MFRYPNAKIFGGLTSKLLATGNSKNKLKPSDDQGVFACLALRGNIHIHTFSSRGLEPISIEYQIHTHRLFTSALEDLFTIQVISHI